MFKYFFILAAIGQGEKTGDLWDTQLSQKRPLGGANGNSKLIHTLLMHVISPCKDLGWNEKLYHPKDNIISSCSNYEKRYHKKRFQILSESSDDYEEHGCSPTNVLAVTMMSTVPKHQYWGLVSI